MSASSGAGIGNPIGRAWRAIPRKPFLLIALALVSFFYWMSWMDGLQRTKDFADKTVAELDVVRPLSLASRYIELFTVCDPVVNPPLNMLPGGETEDCSAARYVSLARPFVMLARLIGEVSGTLSSTGHVIFGIATLMSLIGGFVLARLLVAMTDANEDMTLFLGIPLIPIAFGIIVFILKWATWFVFSTVGAVMALILSIAAFVVAGYSAWNFVKDVDGTAKDLEMMAMAVAAANAATVAPTAKTHRKRKSAPTKKDPTPGPDGTR